MCKKIFIFLFLTATLIGQVNFEPAVRKNTVAQKANNVRKCDAFTGATAGVRIAASISDLPSTGGVADVTGLEGSQTISSTIAIGTKKVHMKFGAATYNISPTLFSFGSGGSIVLEGLGPEKTILQYTTATGNFVSLDTVNDVSIKNLSLTTTAATTSVGVRMTNTDRIRLDYVRISGFDKNVVITGTLSTFNEDIWITNADLDNFKTSGIELDHVIDTYISNVKNYAIDDNTATGSHGIVIDTGSSGVYINSLAMGWGSAFIRNSGVGCPTPGSIATCMNVLDRPPEFVFADQLVADTCPNACIELDSTLSTADGAGRKGKSYHFTNAWAAFSGGGTGQANNTPGILIEGGEDVSFIDARARINASHGIHISGGNNIRIQNASVLGNNQDNAADGDGIRVAAGVTNFQIIGGVSGDDVAGESGHQKYGVRVASGAGANYAILGIDVSTGNDTNGIFNGGSGVNIVCGANGTVDNGGGTIFSHYCNYQTGTGKARIINGDGNSFWDFLTVSNNITIGFDSGDNLSYDRSLNELNVNVGGSQRFRADGTNDATNTGIAIFHNGSLKRVAAISCVTSVNFVMMTVTTATCLAI